ncbi:MAG: DUF3598 family protein [Cyanobacteria bacterium J06597_1]
MSDIWENFFKNSGVWKGCFNRFTPGGKLVSVTPSCLTLARSGDTSASFQIVRYPEGKAAEEFKTEFSSINRSSIFFPDGSFSKGSMQLSPFSEFVAELSLTLPSERLRLVQAFQPGGGGDYLVLIQETREGCEQIQRPRVSFDRLCGLWRGQAMTYLNNWFALDPVDTESKLERLPSGQWLYSWQVGSDRGQAQARLDGSRLLFEQDGQPYQLLLLPYGGASLCPIAIQRHAPFRCELMFFVDSTIRLRIIRRYLSDGSWVDQSLIREEKID